MKDIKAELLRNEGSADLAADVRALAVKLYTQRGNWHIIENNIPVVFIQDAIKFPDLIHAAKHNAERDVPAKHEEMISF